MLQHYASRLRLNALASNVLVGLIVMVLATLAGAAHAAPEYDPLSADWRALFNGKDLDGWTPKITGHAVGEDPHDTFRVENGMLKVRYDNYTDFGKQFGHLFFDEAFSHYALFVEYRFVGEQAPGGPKGWAVRNSGAMLHAQAPATMTLHQEFPNSIEAQFLGGLGDGKPRPTANLCTPGTHVHLDGKLFTPHCTPSTSPTLDGDQWVQVTMVVLGAGTVRHFVNGEEVLTYSKPQSDDGAAHSRGAQYLNAGYIALQSESHPIDFRTVAILDLAGCTDTTADNYQAWAIKQKPGSCVHTAPAD